MLRVPTYQQVAQYNELIENLTIESDEEYHKQRGAHVTSSSLKDFIKSPRKYFHKHVSGDLVQEETEALYLGSLIHCVVLEGSQKAHELYVIGGPRPTDKDGNEGNEYGFKSKKFKAAQDEARLMKGKRLARSEDYALALKMKRAVGNHPVAKHLITGKAERVVRGTWLSLPVQIKMDLINMYGIIDLKTVADIDNFYTHSSYCDVHKYGYLYSAAFYREILHKFNPGIPRQPFYFVVVEKKEPFTVGVWEVDKDILDEYSQKIAHAMNDLKVAKIQQAWDCPYDEIRRIDS